MTNISGIVKSARKIMRQDTGTGSDELRILQLGWMLFLKIFSDKDKELELIQDDYLSPIPEALYWDKWAGDDEGMTGDELLKFVDQTLFPTLGELDLSAYTVGSTASRRALLVHEVFANNYNYMKSGIHLRQVINKLNEIDFNNSKDKHIFGQIYETFLSELQSAGPLGEFYTPRAKESADLFLILMIHLLKDGGRAAIVLPDGSLTGDGVKQRIRQKWLEDCNLHTIIRLPNSVFQPYASVATNLLFFTKGESTKNVWYYEHKLPEAYKAYSKTKPIQLAEFDGLKAWWKKRKENEQAWQVDMKIIKANGYNLDIKNPHQPEEEKQYSSRELLDLLHQSFAKGDELLGQLRKELI